MSNDAIRIPDGPSSWVVILEPILLQQVSGLSVDKEVNEKNLWKSTGTLQYVGKVFLFRNMLPISGNLLLN
jgi:hypothetical protein